MGAEDEPEAAEAILDFFVDRDDGGPSNAALVLRLGRLYRDFTGTDVDPPDRALFATPHGLYAFLAAFVYEAAPPRAGVELVWHEFESRHARPGPGTDALALRTVAHARIADAVSAMAPADRLLLAFAVVHKRAVRYELRTVRSSIARLSRLLPAYGREVEPRRLSTPVLHDARSVHNVRYALEDLAAAFDAALEDRLDALAWLDTDFAGFLAILASPRRGDLIEVFVEAPLPVLGATADHVGALHEELRHVATRLALVREERRDLARLRYAARSVWVAVLFSSLAIVVSALGVLSELGIDVFGWLRAGLGGR